MRIRSTSLRATSRSIARRASTTVWIASSRSCAVNVQICARRCDLRLLQYERDHAATRGADRLDADVLATLIRPRDEHHGGDECARLRGDEIAAGATALAARELDVMDGQSSVRGAAVLDGHRSHRRRPT
jgi:hypothetical protein